MSDLTLNITLTDAGLAAVAAAHGPGLQAKITHVGIGDVGHAPGPAAVGLHHELARVALTAGGAVAPKQVLLQGVFPAGGAEFFIRELGYFLEDGTLLGIWSDPVTPLGWVGGATPWFFKLAFAWTALPDDSITVLIADDAGQAGMALDLSILEAKVRHTVETGGGLIWTAEDNAQLTAAILHMIATHGPDLSNYVQVAALAAALETYARLNAAQTFTAAQRGQVVALADGATITPDFALGNYFTLTLGGNRTLAAPSNLVAGQAGCIFILQDGTGSRTLSFAAAWDFRGGIIPSLSTSAGAVDRLDYVVRSNGSIHAALTKDAK